MKVVVVVGKGGVSRKSLEMNLKVSADQDFQIQKACTTEIRGSFIHPLRPIITITCFWKLTSGIFDLFSYAIGQVGKC